MPGQMLESVLDVPRNLPVKRLQGFVVSRGKFGGETICPETICPETMCPKINWMRIEIFLYYNVPNHDDFGEAQEKVRMASERHQRLNLF